jgi:CheY-like chemotaxis protein
MEGAVAALLPEEASEAAAASLRRDGLAGLRVLVVDDAEDAREALSVLLASMGRAVTAVGSADEALLRPGERAGPTSCSRHRHARRGRLHAHPQVRARDAARGGRVPGGGLTGVRDAGETASEGVHAGYTIILPKPVDPDGLDRDRRRPVAVAGRGSRRLRR